MRLASTQQGPFRVIANSCTALGRRLQHSLGLELGHVRVVKRTEIGQVRAFPEGRASPQRQGR